MNRRFFSFGATSLVLFLALFGTPAIADDDDGGDDEQQDDDEQEDDGGGDDNGDDDDGGDDGGDDSGSGGTGSGGSGSGSSELGDDHEDARLAVVAKDAMPLSEMLARFRSYGNYTVIDVKLSRSNKTLLYVIKYIDDAGEVRKSYFDAKTARLVK
ncbi:MAG: hypothetical protein HY834_01580 [Devosia nanyangense]|uniref:PepSY domain-containing protein n=1 Tax=Devosia nanyangense TaxID=1228055 RepID=A0A933KZL2_9HYPH|nr:hypothetical protein [Devosia nanyangense]